MQKAKEDMLKQCFEKYGIKNGDYLEVLEVGNCALTSGTIAGADTIKVEYGNNSEWQYCNQQTGPSVGCTISF